ncbi:TauD/TfdA family dioxygenase [Streptomyces chartreusis]|uniref:TauD/TfdA family dioxygenase n=1 Tax=Streptomyces chartreusis TaxID=1969 RepID=UPI0036B08E4F
MLISGTDIRVERTELTPFGALVETADERDFREIPNVLLARLIAEFKVVVLRGFSALTVSQFTEYARSWGPLLSQKFGEVLELVVRENPDNYVFTPGPVPFHFDGPFADDIPSYMFFHCIEAPAPGAGGRTSFCEAAQLYADESEDVRRHWENLSITYSAKRQGHYGGSYTSPLVAPHPITGVPTVRYAEPLPPAEFDNPLHIDIHGMPVEKQQEFIEQMGKKLYADLTYTHEWHDGDYVLVDNHAVLHHRERFHRNSPRHIRRVQIL